MRDWLAHHRLGYKLALPLLFYLAAAVFITWPLVTQLSTHVLGIDRPDSLEYVRLGWWGKYALQHGLNPFYQSLLGYPDGFFSAIQWVQPLIYWPISALNFLVDPAAAFNLWMLLTVSFCGLTAYWLCLTVLEAPGPPKPAVILAALYGGLVFMAFPTMQSHLMGGQVDTISNYALPLVLLALYRIVNGNGKLRTALLGALALFILLISNYTAPVYAILPVVLFGGGYWLLRQPKVLLQWKVIRLLAIVFIVGGLLAIPFYTPMAAEALSPQPPAYLQEGGWVYFSPDLLNFVALSPLTPWTKNLAPPFSIGLFNSNLTEGPAYLGLAAVALGLIALARRRRQAALWAVLAIGCLVFSLGPILKFNNQQVVYTIGEDSSHIVLPWALFQNLPLLKLTRTAGRFNFTAGLALGILSAIGLQALLQFLDRAPLSPTIRRIMPLAMLGLLSVFTLAEYQVQFPCPTTPIALPAYFSNLAARPEIRAVFDVPWDDYSAQRAALYQQTVHHKPLVAGYVTRSTTVDPAKLTILSDLLLGKAWNAQDPMGLVPGQPVPAEDIPPILNQYGIDVVVYHWDQVDRKSVLAWANQAFSAAAYQDDKLAIFETPHVAASVRSAIAALPVPGWWQQPNAPAAQNLFWMTGSADLYLYTPGLMDTRLALNWLPLLHTQHLDLAVDGHYFRSWVLNQATTPIDVLLRLEPGFHTLHFTVAEGCVPAPVAPACLLDKSTDSASRRELNFDDPACDLKNLGYPIPVSNVCVSTALSRLQAEDAGPMAYHERAVQLDDGLTLQGYRLPAEISAGQPLPVETDWAAIQKLPGDYHVFVHVLDQQGQMVAQYDGTPNQGRFPTGQWAASQRWIESDTVALPQSLAPGAYQVYVGWYRYPDLQRLHVQSDAPGASDGMILLGAIQVR